MHSQPLRNLKLLQRTRKNKIRWSRNSRFSKNKKEIRTTMTMTITIKLNTEMKLKIRMEMEMEISLG